MALHFPQAFATSLFGLSLAPLIFRGVLRELFFSAEKILALFLPLFVAAAMLAGFLDGRARFGRIRRSLILRTKIVVAALFLGFSLALSILTWLRGLGDSPGFVLWLTALALGTVACSAALGILGGKVVGPIVPDD
jgi:hypothetical protein